MTEFDPAGSSGTYATALNDRGVIAGYYQDGTGLAHGFVRKSGGNFVTFDVAGAAGTFPNSINRGGDIAGWYTDASGTYHGFVRTR